jgi:hypothetical protein
MPSVDVKEARYGPIVAIVNSRTEPDKRYEVRQKNGTLSCQCPGWRFSKSLPRACRHTRATQLQGPVQAMTPQAVTAAKAAPSPTVQEEARLAAKDVLQYRGTHEAVLTAAAQRIEVAMRKFLKALPTPAIPVMVEATGFRLITLDE